MALISVEHGRALGMALVLSLSSAATLAQSKAYVGNFKDDTVSVVDTERGIVVATIPTGHGPHGTAVSRDGHRVFVGGDGGSTLTVIDTSTDRAIRDVEVGQSPHGFAMQPDGRALLVGVYGEDRVAWLDLDTLKTVASVSVPKPHTIAVEPAGRIAYVASQQPGRFALVVIDLARHAVLREVPLNRPPRDLEFDPDGHALYFTMAGEDAVQVLDPVDDRIVATIPTGVSPHLATVFKGAPSGLVVVQGPGEVMRFDPSTLRPGTGIRVGQQPHWMSPIDGGRSVAVTNEGSDSLSLVDLSSGAVRTVAVGRAPRKVVAVGQAAAVVSIANFAFSPTPPAALAGTEVRWSNDDGAPHGIRFDDGAAGDELLLPGQRFARTFKVAGVYRYTCSVHPFMVGAVVIQPERTEALAPISKR